MIGRLLFKLIVFALIIAYFTFYEYNNNTKNVPHNEVSHLSTLLLNEQKLIKELGVKDKEVFSNSLLEAYRIPYIEGTLIEIVQDSDHIVLAKVRVTSGNELNIKANRTISIYFSGHLTDENLPKLNEHYKWLIQANEGKNDYYFIQGGKQGIIPLN